MYSLNKKSRLVTISAEAKLSDLKKQLAEEGLYLGYYPLDEIQYSFSYYLHRRVANFYHFKYGSLADQIASLQVEMKNGKSFQLKSAPRAAIGPDFNRIIIGGKEHLGTARSVTLKTVALPEKIIYGIVLLKSREQAKALLCHLIGQFMPPLFFKYFELDLSTTILDQLHFQSEPFEIFLFCLSGLQEIVTVEESVISDFCLQNHWELMWVANKEGRDLVNAHLHTLESYREIKDQYRQFIWPASDHNHQALLEKQFHAPEIPHVR